MRIPLTEGEDVLGLAGDHVVQGRDGGVADMRKRERIGGNLARPSFPDVRNARCVPQLAAECGGELIVPVQHERSLVTSLMKDRSWEIEIVPGDLDRRCC